MRILVTGATGRVGANLVKALSERGHEVRGLVRPNSPRAAKLGPLDVEVVKADLADAEGVFKAAEGMEAIYHIGATMRARSDRDAFQSNLLGTFNVMEAAKKGCPNLKRVVFAATDAVVPHSGFIPDLIPEDIAHRAGGIYGITKECGEIFCRNYHRQYGLPAVIVRFPFIVGAGELLDRSYFRGFYFDDYRGRCDGLKHLTSEEEEAVRHFKALGASTEERLFIPRTMDGIAYQKHIGDVRDIVDGLMLILEKDEAAGQSMNLMGCPLKWEEAVPYLSEKIGVPYVEAKLPSTPMYYEYSMETARNVLGFVPKYDSKAMIDGALAVQRGEDIGVILS